MNKIMNKISPSLRNTITTLLDTDLYKFTMANVAYSQFPDAVCTYEFKCRDDVDLTPFEDLIAIQINKLSYLRFREAELEYLKTLGFLDDAFIDYLENFSLNPKKEVKVFNKNGKLHIEVEGKWLDTIWYEIPILAIVNEIYFECTTDEDYTYSVGMRKLHDKIEIAKREPFAFVDFGTRRRYSRQWQEKVVNVLSTHKDINFTGTSNIMLAQQFGIRPTGTMAHEFLQAAQALAPNVADSQKFALDCWLKQYDTQLGIALTDIFGLDYFLEDFDYDLASRYSGVRHDSGDPFQFAEKMINHYQKLGIDPKTKTLVFSDGLNFEKARELYQRFHETINVSFGIGTNLTNDVGYKPLSIVMKMVTCNGKPTVKLSDSPGKIMCKDQEYIKEVRKIIKEKVDKGALS